MNQQFIEDFYKDPKELKKEDHSKIITLLDKYKRELVEDKYVLLVTDKDIIYKLFILFLYFYDDSIKKELDQDKTKKFHIGIDFEFNVKDVALMQLNFGKYLWVIDPKYYDINSKNIINEKLFLNKNAYKVFHGADSLDLPYLFSSVFDNDKEKILKFTKKYIDTRFLCEYVRNSKKEEGKCSIYDAMYYMGTLNKSKYDELLKISESMGPIQDVMWDIKKLSSFHIKYAFYDVLHLLDFMADIYKKINKETPSFIRSYYYIIELIRFAILERKGITDVLEFTKQVINPMNNYFVNTTKTKKTFIEIYNDFTKELVIIDTFYQYKNKEQDQDKNKEQDKKNKNKEQVRKVDFNFIESVNYIKGILSFLLKYVLYGVIINKYTVHKNKKDIMKEKINLDELYEKLDNIGMSKIKKLLKLFEEHTNKKLIL